MSEAIKKAEAQILVEEELKAQIKAKNDHDVAVAQAAKKAKLEAQQAEEQQVKLEKLKVAAEAKRVQEAEEKKQRDIEAAK